MFCSVSEKRGMHEFAYFSIGGLPTKSGSTASAASQYSLRNLHVNIMLNPHAATQVRMSSYERQAGSNPNGVEESAPEIVFSTRSSFFSSAFGFASGRTGDRHLVSNGTTRSCAKHSERARFRIRDPPPLIH
jgi:hypothetical protein